MKYLSLLLAIISLLFSVYFFIERSDIFLEIFNGRPFNQIPFSEMLKPILLLILGIFFFYIFRKQTSNNQNNEK
jgi:hypothetical protein